MLVIGAKGLAQEILDTLHSKNELENLAFYDDVNKDIPDLLFDKFNVLKTEEEVAPFFKKNGNQFILGIGFPIPRHKLYNKFINLGGDSISLVSDSAIIGHYNCYIEKGVYISLNVCISSSVSIKTGAFINAGSIIGHDTSVGEFCVICPSTNIGGHCNIGDLTFIGTGVIIYPNVTIGRNVSISAGSIVRKNIPDNAIVHGLDGKIIKIKPTLS